MLGSNLKILVIDEDPGRAAVLEGALVEAGYTHSVTLRTNSNLHQRIMALEPDVVIIDLQNPDRDTLESMFQVSRAVQKPIAMFVDQSDDDSIRRAVNAGVSAYVVDGLKKDRVKPVVELAVSRFESFSRIVRERDEARTALAERKTIDKAKGLLMDRRQISEDEAYRMMRQTAMQQSRRLFDIAESIITAFELDAQLFGGADHG
ncbi:MAG: ANTAR domain-containing protein [Kordiimonadaceae bacterium]|nr:ANTAR domain-containing protein [Kordiimonadaceae bacterium]MBO6567497.1 ANTAR domain-containing protein [Kordiimonadaceae bacterium]MBO6963289.1 ANTAR domain-containing protein [Kordiimonadaceae bacterium]